MTESRITITVDQQKPLSEEDQKILNQLLIGYVPDKDGYSNQFYQRQKAHEIELPEHSANSQFDVGFSLTMFPLACEKNSKKIHYEVLSRKDPIGKGQSYVYEVGGTFKKQDIGFIYKDRTENNTQNNQERVAKIILIDDEDNTRENIEKEYALSKKATHLGIKKPVYFNIDDSEIACIVMNKLPGCDLYDLLIADIHGNFLTTDQRIDLCIALIEAIDQQVHKKSIIHRDLKPENIKVLVTKDKIIVNIFDFNLSKDVDDYDDNNKQGGSPAYVSPEVVNGLTASEKSDIHALSLIMGLIFHAYMREEPEVPTPDAFNKIMKEYDFPNLFAGIHDLSTEHQNEIKNMLLGSYEIDADKRLNSSDILAILKKIKLERSLSPSNQLISLK